MKFIIKISLLLLFALNFITIFAIESEDNNVLLNNKKVLHDLSLSDKIRKLETNPKWQKFVRDRELVDLNYDLYRVETNSNIDPKIFGAQDPRSYFINKHYTKFCSSKVEQNNCYSSSLYEYADIRASLLLDQNIYSDEEYSLLTEVTRNIINPFPSIMPIEMRTATVEKRNDSTNKLALSEALASQARLGVARNSFNQIILNRLPLNLLDKADNNTQNNFSVLSLMEQEAKKRFESNVWQEEVAEYTQEKLLKELVKMEAFKMWMEYYKYKQNERIEALLATILAQQNTLNQTLIEREQNR